MVPCCICILICICTFISICICICVCISSFILIYLNFYQFFYFYLYFVFGTCILFAFVSVFVFVFVFVFVLDISGEHCATGWKEITDGLSSQIALQSLLLSPTSLDSYQYKGVLILEWACLLVRPSLSLNGSELRNVKEP